MVFATRLAGEVKNEVKAWQVGTAGIDSSRFRNAHSQSLGILGRGGGVRHALASQGTAGPQRRRDKGAEL